MLIPVVRQIYKYTSKDLGKYLFFFSFFFANLSKNSQKIEIEELFYLKISLTLVRYCMIVV